MKSMIVSLLFASLLSTPVLAGSEGGQEGHGGDVVFCKPSYDNAFNGYHVLDEVMGSEYGQPRLLHPHAPNWASSVKGVDTAFTDPKLCHMNSEVDECDEYARSWKQFVDAFAAPNEMYSWKPSAGPLSSIQDEDLMEPLPKNCRSKGIRQAVRRVRIGSRVRFYYDAKLLADLQKTGRLSWLLAHEWLWGYLDQPESMRMVNHALHAEKTPFSEKYQFPYLMSELSVDRMTPPAPGFFENSRVGSGYRVMTIGSSIGPYLPVTFVWTGNGPAKAEWYCKYSPAFGGTACGPFIEGQMRFHYEVTYEGFYSFRPVTATSLALHRADNAPVMFTLETPPALKPAQPLTPLQECLAEARRVTYEREAFEVCKRARPDFKTCFEIARRNSYAEEAVRSCTQ